jgi:hypothetical protein
MCIGAPMIHVNHGMDRTIGAHGTIMIAGNEKTAYFEGAIAGPPAPPDDK